MYSNYVLNLSLVTLTYFFNFRLSFSVKSLLCHFISEHVHPMFLYGCVADSFNVLMKLSELYTIFGTGASYKAFKMVHFPIE